MQASSSLPQSRQVGGQGTKDATSAGGKQERPADKRRGGKGQPQPDALGFDAEEEKKSPGKSEQLDESHESSAAGTASEQAPQGGRKPKKPRGQAAQTLGGTQSGTSSATKAGGKKDKGNAS